MGHLPKTQTQLYSEVGNSGIPIVKKITDLYSIKASGFYYYDAGATNAPVSTRGGMVIADYLNDSWVSLIAVPYALSKIYTNTKYSNIWIGWAENILRDDLASRDTDYPSLMRCRSDTPDLNSTSIPVGGYYYSTTASAAGKNTPEGKTGYALIFGNGPDRTGQLFVAYDGYLYYKSVYGSDPATYKWRKLQGTSV